jgi:hypothetical protein
LVQDGDEVIIFRGVDEEVLEKDHDILRDDAREFMRVIQAKSAEADPDRKVRYLISGGLDPTSYLVPFFETVVVPHPRVHPGQDY